MSTDSSSDDEQDTGADEVDRQLDEDDRKHFKYHHVKPRSQVIVHTKYDSLPITAVTSGLPSLLPFRDKRCVCVS